MTLINRPDSYQQMALAFLDAGVARDIAFMLADAYTVLDGIASAGAPAAAREAAAILVDHDSAYTLPGLAAAVGVAEGMLRLAVKDALAGVPPRIPGS
jgi:hypothetical protein